MAKVTLGGAINIQGTKKISRTNLAHLREPAINTRLIVAALMSLCELKEEKERQGRLADEALAEVSLAKEEIKAATMRLNAAKMKWQEATGRKPRLKGQELAAYQTFPVILLVYLG